MIRQLAKVILVVFLTVGTITVAFFTVVFVGIVSFLSAIFGGGRRNGAYPKEADTGASADDSASAPDESDSGNSDGKAHRIRRYDGDDVIDV